MNWIIGFKWRSLSLSGTNKPPGPQSEQNPLQRNNSRMEFVELEC